ARRPRRHGRPPARLAERVVDPLPAPERVAGLVPLLVKRVLPTIQRLVANPVLQAAPELRITIRHERPPMVRRVARLAFPGFPVRRAPLGRRGLLRLQRRLGEVRQLRLRHARLRLLPRPFSRELGRHEPSLLISACSHVRPPALHRCPLRQTALAPSATPCLPLRPLWEIPARSSPPGNNRACRQTGRMYDRSQRRGTLPSRSRPAHPADRQPPHATGQRDAPSVAASCAARPSNDPPQSRTSERSSLSSLRFPPHQPGRRHAMHLDRRRRRPAVRQHRAALRRHPPHPPLPLPPPPRPPPARQHRAALRRHPPRPLQLPRLLREWPPDRNHGRRTVLERDLHHHAVAVGPVVLRPQAHPPEPL